MLTAHAESETGPVRSVNEDAWLVAPEIGLFAVADGMGGHNAGEVASQLALEALCAASSGARTADSDLSWPYGVDPELSFLANRLRTAIHLANRRVFRAAEGHDDYTGMGTTLVGLLVDGDRAVDRPRRRQPHLSADAGRRVRADHAGRLLGGGAPGAGARGRPSCRSIPMRHVLTNVIGARDQVDVASRRARAARPATASCSAPTVCYDPMGDDELQALLAAAGTSAREGARAGRRGARAGLARQRHGARRVHRRAVVTGGRNDAPASGPATPLPSVVARAMPERIGQFRVVERIGRGAMGVVYSARDDRNRVAPSRSS